MLKGQIEVKNLFILVCAWRQPFEIVWLVSAPTSTLPPVPGLACSMAGALHWHHHNQAATPATTGQSCYYKTSALSQNDSHGC